MSKDLYTNYGDCNPLDYDGLWLKKIGDNEYHFVKVDNTSWCCGDEIPTYILSSGYIYTADDWINRDSVINYSGLDKNIDSDTVEYAIGCLEYYGGMNFSSDIEEYKTTSRREARKYINSYGIVIHRSNIA